MLQQHRDKGGAKGEASVPVKAGSLGPEMIRVIHPEAVSIKSPNLFHSLNRNGNVMQFLKGIAVTLLCLVSSSVLSVECPVSTAPRAIFSELEQLANERFEPDHGKYSATFRNGDSVTARFDLCGLGISASYLIEGDAENLSEKISLLLTHVIPEKNSASDLAARVVSYSKENFQRGLTLQGVNGDHWVQIKESPSPLYSGIIHYRWIPPEY
ncbi:hypothetical protein [Microbulbifer sp. YPW1]|uniref:hypothetical protein n=1 Tax=Microbulbifer sp. YPW1 TaxID=2745199 RepID=UPI001598ADFD|nr:hypothetical protein [Microbulbifer sp. YPW1]QKX16780.1 hypothetical protein HUW35_07090 [Microbulbifer sp. YPW1]